MLFRELGLTSKGKGRPIFFDKLCEACRNIGIDAAAANYETVLNEGETDPATSHAILVLNEIDLHRFQPRKKFDEVANRLRNCGYTVHTDFDKHAALGDKYQQNALFRANGVAMPEPVESIKSSEDLVFSNTVTGAANPSQVLAQDAELDLTRYNTRFIDSTHEFRGEPYYVSLRTLAVGRKPITTVVRASPTSSENPNVRNKTTPLDAQMINHFHNEVAVPAQEQVADMCQKIGRVLGFGFFAHDLIPEASTGKLYLSEVGFKINDGHYLSFFKSIKNKLPTPELYNGDVWESYAVAVREQLGAA